MSETTIVDAGTLREQVRDKSCAVAAEPGTRYHFHTGRPLADRIGYDPAIVDALPDRAVESFAGVDMTPEMPTRATATAIELDLDHVPFRHGYAEGLPVDDDWADTVISNEVINLCADQRAVFDEIRRALRPGGTLQFADIANGRPVPIKAIRDVDLWTG